MGSISYNNKVMENITNIKIEGLNSKDHPDYVDAYIASADLNGKPMTDQQLDELSNDGEFMYKFIHNE